MPLSFWSKRFPRLARRPRKLPAPHRPFRPCVESLEPRTAPAVLTVTSAADTHQAGLLTLREAVAAANTDAAVGQSDTIIFDPALGGATIKLTAGPLEQSGVSSTATETIDGGGWITVSCDDTSGVFTVDTGVTATLTGLTIADGNATNGSGGGIYNAGTLTVQGSTISGNFATDGGGIYNGGTLTLSASTLAGNSALYAGGIENYGTLTLSNSTLSGNAAASFGGGLWSAAFAPVAVVLTDVTITANRANTAGLGGQGGGLFVDPGSNGRPVLHNTLIAGNYSGATATSRDDVSGMLDSGSDYNLIGDGTGMTGVTSGVNGNLVGSAATPIDPLLGPLQDNGGDTPTMALLAGSSALNAGDPAQVGVPDQRGVGRSGGVNIGAYQASASAFVLTAPDTVMAGMPFDVTVTAVDMFGQTALGYTGTVTFSTTDPDPGVVLPSAYTFTTADQGTHTFSGEFTLMTPDTWGLTAADAAGGFSASLTVTVTP